MHYTGMAAIQIMPTISYDPLLVGASIAIAVTASFAALWLAFKLLSGQSWLMILTQRRRRGCDGICHHRHALHRYGCLDARARLNLLGRRGVGQYLGWR